MENITSLILDSAHGTFIPQIFARMILEHNQDVYRQQSDSVKNSIQKLAKDGSEQDEWYWEDWDDVERNFEFEKDGERFRISQNGDLWEINISELEKLSEEKQEEFWESLCY